MLHLPVLVIGRGEDYLRDCWSWWWWLLYGSAALNSQLESLGCCGVVRQRGGWTGLWRGLFGLFNNGWLLFVGDGMAVIAVLWVVAWLWLLIWGGWTFFFFWRESKFKKMEENEKKKNWYIIYEDKFIFDRVHKTLNAGFPWLCANTWVNFEVLMMFFLF
jgi:hypothetical protein